MYADAQRPTTIRASALEEKSACSTHIYVMYYVLHSTCKIFFVYFYLTLHVTYSIQVIPRLASAAPLRLRAAVSLSSSRTPFPSKF